jgi:folylpolyglutamate synthase/dihydropteroate synthase
MANVHERISEYRKFGSKLGLERMEALCGLIGNPQDSLRVIHVAGTNGKGSVCRYIYEVLRALGYRVGIYASPYITEFGERMEVDGAYISESELQEVAEEVFAAAEQVARGEIPEACGEPDENAVSACGETGVGQPTEFEVVTAMAFLWYARKGTDFVVMEVGLGGRGDSTNVVKAPLLSVITSVSLDHIEQLGNTIAEIAAEKAGIIKAGVPVICGAAGEAARVIAKRAYEVSAPLTDAAKYAEKARRRARSVWDALRTENERAPEAEASEEARAYAGGLNWPKDGGYLEQDNNKGYARAGQENGSLTRVLAPTSDGMAVRPIDAVWQVVTADIDAVRYGDIELAMAGAHQAENAVIAMTAIENLRRRNLVTATADGVRAGFRRARLPGRFEVFALARGGPGDMNAAAPQNSAKETGSATGKPPLPIVLDGAHNASGAAALAAAVRGSLSGAAITTVVGILSDKDVDAILWHIYWFSDHIILTRPANDRAADPSGLADRIARLSSEFSCGCGDPSCGRCGVSAGPFYRICPDPAEALHHAISKAEKTDGGAVVVCGSLYLISTVRNTLLFSK